MGKRNKNNSRMGKKRNSKSNKRPGNNGLVKVLAGALTLGALSLGSYTLVNSSEPQDYLKGMSGEVKHYDNSSYPERIIYFPQLHMTPNGREDGRYKFIRENQEDIFKAIVSYCEEDNICLLGVEGYDGELRHEKIENDINEVNRRHPGSGKLSEYYLDHAIRDSLQDDSAILAEYTLKNKLKTIGVELNEVNDLAIKSVDLFRKAVQLYDKSLISEDEVNEMNRAKNEITINLRSEIAVKRTLEAISKEGVQNAMLLYGGGHTDSIIRYCKEAEVDLTVVELDSYRDGSSKIYKLVERRFNGELDNKFMEFKNNKKFNPGNFAPDGLKKN